MPSSSILVPDRAGHPIATRRVGRRAVLATLLATLVLAACGSTTPSPSSPPSPSPSPGPELGFRLRATTVQALPPDATFTWTPMLLITDDLIAIQAGAIPLVFPGPLVTPLIGSQLTEEAWAEIAKQAGAAGLLSDETDFSGGGLAPGAAAARLQLVVDGRSYDLTGNPELARFCGGELCPAEPGTPEAFATFWSLLGNLPGWVPGVGQGQPYVADAYAVLVGPPADDQGLNPRELAWPFAASVVEFGKPLSGDATRRCGVVRGDEAAAFAVALANADQLTRWHDPATPGDAGIRGLIVRPLLPGDDDPCAPLVGG
jgi:hypothetical protein